MNLMFLKFDIFAASQDYHRLIVIKYVNKCNKAVIEKTCNIKATWQYDKNMCHLKYLSRRYLFDKSRNIFCYRSAGKMILVPVLGTASSAVLLCRVRELATTVRLAQ